MGIAMRKKKKHWSKKQKKKWKLKGEQIQLGKLMREFKKDDQFLKALGRGVELPKPTSKKTTILRKALL